MMWEKSKKTLFWAEEHVQYQWCIKLIYSISNSGYLGHRERVGGDVGKVNRGQIMKGLIGCGKGFKFYLTGYR